MGLSENVVCHFNSNLMREHDDKSSTFGVPQFQTNPYTQTHNLQMNTYIIR